ncbi:MAG: cupin domain-containing protein [Pseudomonadota bacterium]
MKKMTLLGGMTPAVFLRDYWQKKPLLVRQAMPGFLPVLPAADVFALSLQEDVESRLISRSRKRWQLQHGPFTTMPPTSASTADDWTLLVQGVNLHDERADALLRQFRFVPDSRLDDLMISYASDGGGVGAHVDSYDVFLLQAHGQRRWRISAQKDLTLIDGLPLKVLKDFVAEQEYVLEPGDMLYLPPNYAHEGTAVGECMTYSIGFRAAAYQEIGEAFLQFMAESIDLPGRYADPHLAPSKRPAHIDASMLHQVAEQLQKVRFNDEDIIIFLGEHLSEPKATVVYSIPSRPLSVARFAEACTRRRIVLSLKTIMLYRGRHVFINGESFAVRRADIAVLSTLADQREISNEKILTASDDVRETLYEWYRDGWLQLA